ncbi:MAG: glycoside hydrolase family 130 protein [Lachnospirales bacterium]
MLKTRKEIVRYEKPVLTSKDVPYPSSCVFNAGVVKYKGKYIMVFRNDYDYLYGPHFGGTNIGLCYSDDGINWKVEPEPCFALKDDEINRVYDPRLTVIDDKIYMCFAMDTKHGVRGGIATTNDFHLNSASSKIANASAVHHGPINFEILTLSTPDNRNMVLFPEKINNKYVRLERPFTVYSRGGKDRFDIWSSESPDLVYWGNSNLVLGVEDFYFCNNKIGPAAPPIKTEKGWLTIIHTVDLDESRGKNGWEDIWQKRYCAAIVLLDLENPSKVIGMCKEPLMVPEVDFEIKDGFRTNVIFPTGMILEDDGEVKIYYGAADTVIALATANVHDLINLCLK